MVLLHILHALSRETGWKLAVAHLNHQLRGASSNADERLVRGTAARLGLPVVVGNANVRQLSRKEKASLEMAARKARHQFLARTAARLRLRLVALAHHADDQLELFFLRLLRGSGGQALSGMKWKSRSPAAPGIELVRPLLEIPKAALREYAFEHKIRYREDASNACLEILRNRVRHHLLPLLKRRYQPALSKVIGRTVELHSSESDFVELAAAQWLEQLKGQAASARRSVPNHTTRRRPRCASFDGLHVAVQRRALHAQLLALGIVPDYDLIERLRTLCGVQISVSRPVADGAAARPRAATAGAARRFSILRDTDGLLHLRKTAPRTPGFAPASLVCQLGRAGTARFSGAKLSWKLSNGNPPTKPKSLAGRELFDADKVGPRVILRHWQPGDRFQPSGMSAPVKLQDLFTNQRIPREVRRELLLATTADREIFWVEGLRISERFKLTRGTVCRLYWTWERL